MKSWGRWRAQAWVRWLPEGLCLLLALVLLALVPGCTRRFYRKYADKEVNDILAEKTKKHPNWDIEQFHVYPDPRSRFADPTNPDHPPMPPDDNAAWALSPHPQQPGKAGVAYVQGTAWLDMIKAWDEMNRAQRQAEEEAEAAKAREADRAAAKDRDKPAATPPAKKTESLPPPREVGSDKPSTDTQPQSERQPIRTFFDEPLNNKKTPGFLLTLDQTVELGVINSSTFQRFREQLYEIALPVTQQRFSFAFQSAATEDFIRNWAGQLAPGGEMNNWTASGSFSMSKLFSTGALLTFNFANETVWNFLAPKGTNSQSTINLNFVQPLLQGGGKAVTLEPLAQAERNLLYAIRAYARFREQYYVNVAQGTTLAADLATAASGTVSNPISTLAALNIASTDVSGGFTSYLSTLFRELDMAADKKLVSDLREALRIYEGYQEGGQFSPLQVSQVRSTLLQAENTVLQDQQFVTNALDQFKLLLGLPANLPLILDDTPARPITTQLDRYYEVITDSDAAYRRIEKLEELPPDKLRAALMDIYSSDPLVRGTEFRTMAPASWRRWARLTDKEINARLIRLRDERRKLLDRKTDLGLKNQTLSDRETRRLREVEIEGDLGALEQVLRRYEARPWEKRTTELARRQDRNKLFRLVAYSAEVVLVWARNERFEAVGKSWPVPPPAPMPGGEPPIDLSTAEVNLAQETAVQFALANRWDLMNARAQLVDAWRQLRVTANALLGVVNVGYHVTATTPPTGVHPFDFSFARSSNQLFIDTALPLNRLAQRNAYRMALITFQQSRRNLITLEDNVAVQVRFDVRQLQLFGNNYRIQKAVIESLYSQVESAKEVITAPVDPSALQTSGTAGQANAAALTSQYLTALSSLNNSQVRMYDIWLSYLATRMQLYLDLESLRTDKRGVWIEPPGGGSGADSSKTDEKKPSTLPPPHPVEDGPMLHLPRLLDPVDAAPAGAGAYSGGPVGAGPTVEVIPPANRPFLTPTALRTIGVDPSRTGPAGAGGRQ
jgi:outer membrane protein TolC